MSKAGEWFKNLSRIGQVSAVSAVSLGGMFMVTAATPPQISTPATPAVEAVEIKQPVVTTKIETETVSLSFVSQTIEDANLNKGATSIKVTGANGVKTITHKITLTDGKETGRITDEAVTTAPINEVVAVGTYVKPQPTCDSNYSGCVPVVSYDLDCGDIGQSVTVLGYDRHGFDRDRDGYGCESY